MNAVVKTRILIKLTHIKYSTHINLSVSSSMEYVSIRIKCIIN